MNHRPELPWLWLSAVVLCAALSAFPAAADEPPVQPAAYQPRSTWTETLFATRTAWSTSAQAEAGRSTNLLLLCEAVKADFPVPWDWAMQDSAGHLSDWFEADPTAHWERSLIEKALSGMPRDGEPWRAEYTALCQRTAAPADPAGWDLYLRLCQARRATRLMALKTAAPRMVFTKRRTIHPSFFAYTEGQSDAQNERHFRPGAALCLWEPDPTDSACTNRSAARGEFGRTRTLLSDTGGVIRDPAVSWDGQHVVFAWKKSLNEDDYHLYELAVESGRTRQLTSGLGFADYEPAYLPNGHLVFASTRCVQTVDCWWTEVSNLYTCDADGRFLRRLSFDQVHAVYPQVLEDGRVIYTRWDYNDRSQMWPQALFQMNPDGTGQAELYGNNSWFPTTIAHARGIPGTTKLLAIFTGHHTTQAGKLGVLDPARGRQENSGAQLVAPIRETPAERTDFYGQDGELFQYPFALSETEFLVGYAPLGWNDVHRAKGNADFGIYWMNLDGDRELLALDAALACQQPVPLRPRTPPLDRPSTIDYRQTNATCYLQDVYAGTGLSGIPRGTIKKLRVIALEFRAAGIGNNGSSGPGGDALVCTPIAIGNGSWDVKKVLGDATVYPDGSACFTVPARTPIYFQALDAQNHAVQTMRSWSTLQPGETQSCVGCHDPKNSAPVPSRYGVALALQAGPQPLAPFYGPARGFSFPREIQPILDQHCIRCHNDRNQLPTPRRLEHPVTRETDPMWTVAAPKAGRADGSGDVRPALAPGAPAASVATNRPAFSLLGDRRPDTVAKRAWSDAYLNLTLSTPTDYYESVGAYFGVFDGSQVNWIGSQSIPAMLPPYAAGACRSGLFPLLGAGHYGVQLSHEDLDKLAAWMDLLVPYCGDYLEANTWDAEELKKYQHYLAKRQGMESIEQANIQAWTAAGQAGLPQGKH